jgi:hypothetical protein
MYMEIESSLQPKAAVVIQAGRQAANLLMAGLNTEYVMQVNLRQLHEPRFGLPRS